MTGGPARAHLLGLDGPEVRVSARVAALFLEPVRTWIARDHVCDIDALATLHAMEAVVAICGASETGSQTASDVGDFLPAERAAVHDGPMTAKAAADRLGCTDRHVRDLARREVLRGRQLASGQWLFDPHDVDHHAAERAARGA